MVDLEQRKVIDLFPDLESKTVEAWLTAHSGVEVVSRDRSVVYAYAVTAAAPLAIQVADRWHLLKNLSENLERYLNTQHSLLTAVAGELNQKQEEGIKPIQHTNPLISLPATLGLKTIGNDQAMAQLPTEKRYPNTSRSKPSNNKAMAAKPLPAIWVYHGILFENILPSQALLLKCIADAVT